MNILERFGLGKKKARPVGQELETGRGDEAAEARRNVLGKLSIFALLIIVTVAAFPRGEVYEYTVQIGDVWRQQTLVAPFNFPIYKDQDRVREERRRARSETPPYFEEVTDAQSRVRARRDSLGNELDQILSTYASFKEHAQESEREAAREDSLRYLKMRRSALVTLTPSQWQTLAQSYIEHATRLEVDSLTSSDERLDSKLLESAYQLGSQLLSIGVMNRARDSVQTETITIRNEAERVQREVAKDNVYGLNEAYNYAREQFNEQYPQNPEWASIAFAIFRDTFHHSLRYMRAETIQERDRVARNVSPIFGGVERGEIIVSKGERITSEIKRKLTSLEREKNDRAATTILWKQLSGELLFALLVYFVFFLYLFFVQRDLFDDNRQVLLISLIFLFIIALFGVGVRMPWVHLYAVPVALASVQLTVLYNSRIGILGTLALAFIGGQMLGLDLEYTFATFTAGTLGVFSVRDIKNRGQFFLSAIFVFIGYALVLTASWLYLGSPQGQLGNEMMFAAIGSSFTITSYLVLWGLERTFDITTDLTLLELSDTNRRALKDLSLRAPGSFNHSLQVANLAEAAADRVGANALLTRVGALYHDIGKMLKPEYFVENQRAGHNPHDRLKPRMSALIIASHVKEGLDMGKKEYNLPERVLKFITMHHGTSRIEYFYRKAVGQTEEGDSPVLESEFRYPGPRPDSKETGIMMLADSVEAASRSLDEPTHKRLKSLIDIIFKERVEDGQLDDTDLTFRDLRLIKETFLNLLMGIYHVRVKYPDQEKEGEREKLPEPGIEMGAPSSEEGLPVGVSVVWDDDIWGRPDPNFSIDQLKRVPGIRDPRAPRPEVADASPYGRRSASAGDGAVAEAAAGATADAQAAQQAHHEEDPKGQPPNQEAADNGTSAEQEADRENGYVGSPEDRAASGNGASDVSKSDAAEADSEAGKTE